MRLNKLMAALTALLTVFLLCACEREIEYPEGVDRLPSYSSTDTGIVSTFYNTSATTVDTTFTTTEKTTRATTEATAEETTVTTEAVQTSATTPFSLSLEDIPDVGVSEYNDNSVTASSSETEFIPETVYSGTTAEITTVATAESEGVVSTEGSTQLSSVEKYDVFSSRPEELLNDGRISAYTGREIISHPYSYYTLSEVDQTLYDMITGAMLCYEEEIKFESPYTYTFEEIYDVYQLIYNDEYRLFYMSPTIEYIADSETDSVVSMRLKYIYDEDEVLTMRQEIYSAAHKILSQITPDMGDYEIVKLFHDSVILNCTYDSSAVNPNTIYGCLVDNKALCQAYSRTFTYLCSEAGIDSFVVLGVADEPHMWNVVKMDGEYYHIDLTWDDPDRSKNPDSIRYDYFGLTDERISQLRQIDAYDYDVPAANGTKYQYYHYNKLVANSVDEAQEIIKAEALRAAEEQRSTIQLMCSDSTVFQEVTGKLFASSGYNVIALLNSVKDQAANKFNTESIYHNTNKNTYTIKIYLDYLD